MSISIILVPMAIAIAVTSAEAIASIKTKCSQPVSENEENNTFLTRFNDAELLRKTLCEHGVRVESVSDLYIIASCAEGNIIYTRASVSEPFSAAIRDVNNSDGFVNDLIELEQEYDMNVQSFTYSRVLNNLPDDMSLASEEVLEDDSILLTINVDD
ncbi:MAG: hypothetical protein IJ861_01715 [Clostridia bacterium]|nr:hypothetical protein [Clostridia bacterium]